MTWKEKRPQEVGIFLSFFLFVEPGRLRCDGEERVAKIIYHSVKEVDSDYEFLVVPGLPKVWTRPKQNELGANNRPWKRTFRAGTSRAQSRDHELLN